MKENIIIAGSSGAIGGEFTELYANNSNVEKIIALSRKPTNTNHNKIQSVEIDYYNEATFKNQVNVFGPFLLVKKLLPLIKKSKGVKIVFLTARVGSISDNVLGGWHSYRSSKSALNMMIKNLAIELKRLNKEHVVIGIHPGTVKSHLSEPFLRHVKHDIFNPKESVDLMTQVISKVSQTDSGKCFDFSGKLIEP